MTSSSVPSVPAGNGDGRQWQPLTSQALERPVETGHTIARVMSELAPKRVWDGSPTQAVLILADLLRAVSGSEVREEWGVRYESGKIVGPFPRNTLEGGLAIWPKRDAETVVRRTVSTSPWEEVKG